MKILAGRPHDLEDVSAVLRANRKTLDTSLITTTLRMLEEALGQSDLLPIFTDLQKRVAKRRAKRRAR